MISLFRRLVLVLLLLACQLSQAASPDKSIAINFEKISVVQFVAFVYGDMLKINYALHPALVDMPQTLTVHFQNDFDKPKLSAFVRDLLAGVGVEVVQKSGYLFLRPLLVVTEPDDPQTFVYKARFRPAAMLVDMTASLFTGGSFTSKRGGNLDSRRSVQPVPVALAPGAPPPVVRPVVPTSATALLDASDADTFVFQGTMKEIDILQKVLAQIDIPVPEVTVRGMVFEVTTGLKDGSAFSLAGEILRGRFGVSLGSVGRGDSLTFSVGGIEAVFSALSSDSRFKSVSNPFVRVKSGGNARFSVGSDVPVLGLAQLDKNGNSVQSVEYKPSGVIFDIRPQVRADVIDLSISQQLSSFVPTTSGVNNSPTLIKREISTNVGAAHGDVIVLGGLDEDKSSADGQGLPFLPDWAKSRGTETSKTQILLVLQVDKIQL